MKLPMPEGLNRVETGVLQFGDDWPGIYLRGDYCAKIIANLMSVQVTDPIQKLYIDSTIELLSYAIQKSNKQIEG
jgi:hypothetical protein